MPETTRPLRSVLGAILLVLPLLTGCRGFTEIGDPALLPVRTDGEGIGNAWLDRADFPTTSIVQVRAFRVPDVEAIAIHGYFLAYDHPAERWVTAEVDGFLTPRNGFDARMTDQRDRRSGETVEIPLETTAHGYHRRTEGIAWVDLDDPVVAEWRGVEAERIIAVLREEYPKGPDYRVWPGANSNSYVTWVLRRAGVPFDPHPLMVGKDCRGPWGLGVGVSPGRSGLQVETPLVGALIDARQGVELHIFCLTLGVDLWPPALKTPFGRFGFAPSR